MRIYLDLVVGLNFLVDFLLLLGTNRLAGFPTELWRVLSASILGGVYAGACLIPGFRFLGNLLWRMVSLALMAGIAFGWNRSVAKRCGIFMLLAMALGGVAVSIGRVGFPALLLAAAGMWLLCHVAFGGKVGGREYVPLEIENGAVTVKLLALRDSGNTLRDPVSGEQVLVVSAEAAERLTGLSPQQLKTPLETLAARQLPGLRLIPCRVVGQTGGMLLGMRFRNVKINGRRQSAVVAFAPEGLGQDSMVQALTGGVI